MNQIYDPPLDYDFGLEFDYATWTMDSEVAFLNVPWDAQYRDVVRFETADALNAYIDSRAGDALVMEHMSYLKPGQPVLVGLRHNRANLYNYIRVRNRAQPGGGDVVKDFYYFITGTEYIAPDTTAIHVQLDLFQTYIYGVEFGNAYLERGHWGIANPHNFDAFGRDYLTVPEGMDVGAEMRVIAKRDETIMGYRRNPNGDFDPDYSIVMVTTQDISANATMPDGSPNYATAESTVMDKVVSGAGLWAFETPWEFRSWLIANKSTPWRTQSIQAVFMVPNLKRYSDTWEWHPGANSLTAYETLPVKKKMFADWRNSAEILNKIPARYRHLKKFFTFPYMSCEMTTWTATPILIRPESWQVADADILEQPSLLPPGMRIDFLPRRYNGDPSFPIENDFGVTDAEAVEIWGNKAARHLATGDDGGEYLDFATRMQNFPSVPIVSNAGLSYLASNSAGIQAAYAGADWSQSRALQGAQTAFDQATTANDFAGLRNLNDRAFDEAMTGISNQQIINQTNTATGVAVAQGVFGQVEGGFNPLAIAGNAVGAIGNNLNAIAGIQSNLDALNARGANANAARSAGHKEAMYMRDTNNDLAQFAAKGDYAQAQLALNAKVRDAVNVQPSMSGQFGGEFSNIINNNMKLSVRWKMIDNAAISTVGEFWLQYGYAVMRQLTTLPQSLMVMSNFTYWKCSKVYLRTAPMPEPHKQGIRGILEKGVTVWSDPDKIGFIDFADNEPLTGVIA